MPDRPRSLVFLREGSLRTDRGLVRRAADPGGRRGRAAGGDRRGRGAAARARRRHRPARRQRLRRLPSDPGLQAAFGDDAVVVLVKGDLDQLVLTSDLGKLLSLEGCLSGNVEGGKVFTDEPAPAPCARDRREPAGPGGARRRDLPQPVRDPGDQGPPGPVEGRGQAGARGRHRGARARPPPGPRTEQQQLPRAAAEEVLTQFRQQLLQLSVDYGQTGLPRLDDPTFVSSVVFDPAHPGSPSRGSRSSGRAPTPRRSWSG